jgi:hypothetical protein
MKDFKVRLTLPRRHLVYRDRRLKSRVLTVTLCLGTSSAALDVMVGVTSEYLLNVGRMLRFMCDKYAKSMTPEVRLTIALASLNWNSLVCYRKLSCIHSSRVESRGFKILSGTSRTTSSGTVRVLLTSRKSLLERIAKL